MAKLTTQCSIIRHILECIAECEGGYVKTFKTKEGDTIVRLYVDIPQEFWCDRCKKRGIRHAKLMARWNRLK